MFADMKSMVIKAWCERYALLAINCMNLESARAAVRVAENIARRLFSTCIRGICRTFRRRRRRR